MSQTAPSPADDVMITERDMLGALEVLSTSSSEPDALIVLTDEEIMGLDSASALTLLGSPYLDQETVDAEASAAAAVRSLAARRLVRTDRDDRENEGEPVSGTGDPAARPVQLDRRLAGVVALRRIPEGMVTVQRTLSGGTTTLAHYLFPDGGVLEEYITVDGFHHMSVPTLDAVPERIRRFVDPFGAAGEDGEPEIVAADDVEQTFDAADTRSLSVITGVTDGAGHRATVVATSDRVRVVDDGRLDDGDQPPAEVQISDMSSEGILRVVQTLIPTASEGPAADDSAPESSGYPAAPGS